VAGHKSMDDDAFCPVTDRTVVRLRARYESPIVAERFKGPPEATELPLYRFARRLFRAAMGLKGRELRQRHLERMPGTDARLEELTPQFFLRNVARLERFLDDELPLEEVRTRDKEAEQVVGRALPGRYQHPELLTHWNIADVVWLRALIKRFVYEEDWRTRFGRELKEHVQGPLYRYTPPGDEGQQ